MRTKLSFEHRFTDTTIVGQDESGENKEEKNEKNLFLSSPDSVW